MFLNSGDLGLTIIVGLGPIGAACARAVDATRDMRLVGLVDVDPEKVGTLDRKAFRDVKALQKEADLFLDI